MLKTQTPPNILDQKRSGKCAAGNRRRVTLLSGSQKTEQQPVQTKPREGTATRGPVVILPGLGNSFADYAALSQRLEDLGHSHVSTVPIQRWQWGLNARAFFTAAYWKCELTPSPILDWYLQRVHETVTNIQAQVHLDDDKADGSGQDGVSLLGHSAGGWLARVYLARYAGHNVRTLVTLGTPHAVPPQGVIDQTRGLLNYVAKHCDTPNQVDKFVCVAGGGTVGKPLGNGSIGQYVAYLSYAAVCGIGQVDGDGVTPMQAAGSDGAEFITCECDHSMLTSPERWYGSDDIVSQWASHLP